MDRTRLNLSRRLAVGALASMLFVQAMPTPAHAQSADYKTLHNLLIRFYGYQRAGEKGADNKNPFYSNSPFPHSQDNHNGQDLSGGWYDAGDFVKFGLPLGFSVYTLLKGYDVFPSAYDDLDSWNYSGKPDGIPDILGEVKVATDYLIKAVISDRVVVTDVGNGKQDHQQLSESGYANSQRTSPRGATVNTGADVAGLYAASLALMSTLYKKHNATYAALCLTKAQQAFTFGLANRKLSAQQNNGEFYSTKYFADKMAAAGVELYRATGQQSYLNHAISFQQQAGSHFFALGYGHVGDLSAFELKRQGVEATSTWLSDVNLAMTRVVTAANASPLIKGAFINADWGNARNASAVAFSAALAFMVTGNESYRTFAQSQTHWVAGMSPFNQSYIVGFGPKAPTEPHHRNDQTLGKQSGKRLRGGVVSGPTPTGNFDASKPENSSWSFNGNNASNYKNTEVALDYNAAMVGAVAFLRDYHNPPPGLIRVTQPLTAAPGNVNLETGKLAISASLEKSAAWKVVLTGATSKAVKTFSGTGTSVQAQWAGESDQGDFMGGENVNLKLDIPQVAAYHLSRTTAQAFITDMKKQPFKAQDVLVDNFNGGVITNALGGTWSTFNDKDAGGSSYTNPLTLAPTAITKDGENGSNALSARLIGASGATHPHAGIRTTFNAAGSAVSLGSASSVIFDVKAAQGDTFYVELEQPGITDKAYYRAQVIIGNTNWNRVRLPFSSFEQPAWRTSPKPLNLGQVASLRFTFYGIGNIRPYLNNIHIENLNIGGAGIRSFSSAGPSMVSGLSLNGSELAYSFSPEGLPNDGWSVEIRDIFGRLVFSREIASNQTRVRLQGLQTGSGLYFLRHVRGGVAESTLRFMVSPK